MTLINSFPTVKEIDNTFNTWRERVKLKFFKMRERVNILQGGIFYSNEKGHPGEEGITVSPFYWEGRVK